MAGHFECENCEFHCQSFKDMAEHHRQCQGANNTAGGSDGEIDVDLTSPRQEEANRSTEPPQQPPSPVTAPSEVIVLTLYFFRTGIAQAARNL